MGCGIEKNEWFYRYFNRLLFCGVLKIGLELVVVVMICVLYVWNCKRKEKKFFNKRIILVLLIELEVLI